MRLLRRIRGSRVETPQSLEAAVYLMLVGHFPPSRKAVPPAWSSSYQGLIPWVEKWWNADSCYQRALLNRVFVWEIRRWWVWMNRLGELQGSLPQTVMDLSPDSLIDRIQGNLTRVADAARKDAEAGQRKRPKYNRERWSKLRRIGEDKWGTHSYTFLAGPLPRPTLFIVSGTDIGGAFVGIDREEWLHAGAAPLSGVNPTRKVTLENESWEEDCLCSIDKAQNLGLNLYTQHIHLAPNLRGRGLGSASFLALWDVLQRQDPQAAFISGGCQTETTAGAYFLWKYLLARSEVEDLSCPGERQVPLARLRRPIEQR